MVRRSTSRRRKPMQHVIVGMLIILLALSPEVASSSSSTSSPTAEGVLVRVDLRRPVGDRWTTEMTADSTAGAFSHVDSHSLGREVSLNRRRKRSLRASARQNKSTSSVREHKVEAEVEVEEQQRKLQDYEGKVHDFEDIISSLTDTSPMEWTGAQWFCLIILLMVLSTIFSCICGAFCGCCRPRYGYGYYGGRGSYGGRGGGGGGGCCSNIFWCLCCFEWCCRDCQDVDACCDTYRGM